MASRRSNRDRASAFDQGPEHPTQVDSLLFGELERVEAERVVVRPVSLDELIIDETIQVRLGGLDEDHVEQLVQVLLNGGEFKDPIITARDAQGEWLSDGFHRSKATRRALERAEPDQVIAPLRAQSHPGGREVAITLAEDGNLKHGKQLSNEEKKHILWARLERGHDWALWSNRRIAAELGVNEITIRRWRAALEESGATNVAGEARVGRDGKSYPAKPQQTAGKARAAERDSDPQTQADVTGNISSEDGDEGVEPEKEILHEYLVLEEQLTVIGDAASTLMKIQPAMLAGFLDENQMCALGKLLNDILDWLAGYENNYGEWELGLVDHLNALLSWVEGEWRDD